MAGYGKTFSQWRDGSGTSWQDYTHHKFVQGLSDGSLPKENFLHYLKQDYVFLVHFSRAWALAVVKANTLSEMKFASQILDGLVNHEMQLHVQTCAELGISEEELYATEEAPQNLAYTRYVLDSGFSGDFLDLMAALAPCVMGYGEIGKHLIKEKISTENPYLDWINTYGGSEYQDLCAAAGQLLDESVNERLGQNPEKSPKWKILQKHFDTAVRLEVDFWEMGLAAQ